MAKFLGVLMAALLAWSLTAADALAEEGRLQQVENMANCAVWNPAPQPNETVTWSGACANGKAQGRGVQVWRYVQDGEWKEEIYTGEMKDGKQHGRGVTVTAAGDRYDGDFRDGNINGRGVFMLANGDRYDGDFLDDKPNGSGTAIISGKTYSGYWNIGCFKSTYGSWANMFSTKEDCGF